MLMQRSKEKELLDLGEEFYSPKEYEECLKVLFKINKLMGIFNGTVKVLKQLAKDSSVLDIGCGDGLFILNLSTHFPEMKFTGIDIAQDGIGIAQGKLKIWKKNNPDLNVQFFLQKQHELKLAPDSVDIILLNFVCHHIEDDDLIPFLKDALASVRRSVIINDLNRSRIAYWFYKLLTPLLFRNRLITHDGLISIKRSFTRQELKSLLHKAGINKYQIKWCFPFRWRVILWKS